MRKMETAVFGGGCFWCTEAIFQRLKGVKKVTSGYAGGKSKNPNYQQIGDHAEVIKIEFDPEQIKYEDLLEVFFATHDPTTLNRQGGDVGEQYRSIVLYTSEEQKKAVEKFIKGEMVTELKPLTNFVEAEDYHQDYYKKNKEARYCQVVINPKLKKLQEKFGEKLK